MRELTTTLIYVYRADEVVARRSWEIHLIQCPRRWHCTTLGLYVARLLQQWPSADVWKADGLKHYVDWAVKEDFGVMDVNIPKLITGVHVSDGYSDEDKAGRSIAMNELAVYLWENYIEYVYLTANNISTANHVPAATRPRRFTSLVLAPPTQALSISSIAAVSGNPCSLLFVQAGTQRLIQCLLIRKRFHPTRLRHDQLHIRRSPRSCI